MIICICEGISKKEIERAAHNGATTVEDIGLACNAGQGCGTCHEQIVDILAQIKLAPNESCAISLKCLEGAENTGHGENYVGIVKKNCY